MPSIPVPTDSSAFGIAARNRFPHQEARVSRGAEWTNITGPTRGEQKKATVHEPCTYERDSGHSGYLQTKSRFPKLLKTRETKVENGILRINNPTCKAGALTN